MADDKYLDQRIVHKALQKAGFKTNGPKGYGKMKPDAHASVVRSTFGDRVYVMPYDEKNYEPMKDALEKKGLGVEENKKSMYSIKNMYAFRR